MIEGPSDRFRNWLDPKAEGAEAWIPAKGDIVRMRTSGPDFSRFALSQAGIRISPDKTYQIKDYTKTEDGYLLSLDEVNVQYITGKRLVSVVDTLQDPLSIDLFELDKKTD